MFNLVVTHEPGGENYRYVVSLLRDILPELVVVDAGPSVVLYRAPDPYLAVDILSRNRDLLSIIYRVIPVDSVVDAYVETVAEEAAIFADDKIPGDRSYRITLHGRLYWRETREPAHTLDAIKFIAEKIDRPVDLENPEYIVYIRSLRLYGRRRKAAVTVTTPDKILSLVSGKP